MSDTPTSSVKLSPDFFTSAAQHAYETLGEHIDANFETQGRSLTVQWNFMPAEVRAAWAATVRETANEILNELQRHGYLKDGLHA